MPILIKRKPKKVGLPPGTLVYTGEAKTEAVKITVIDYDETQLHETEVAKVEDCFPFKETSTVTWINIDGIHQAEVIEAIGKHFGVHPLVLEDLMSTGQRPKMEDYSDHLFVVLKMLRRDQTTGEAIHEQLSLIIGANFVISFQEGADDVFDPVRERIRSGRGRIRRMGADYLAYTLMDVVVDNYFIVLNVLDEQIEALEDEVHADPTQETLEQINQLKRELVFLRRSVWPLREVISGLSKGESELFTESTQLFLRDVYDHAVEAIDIIENFRDMVSGMHDSYQSSVSNRMNEIMKVLTIMATIFIPLTFIAGIYGMNFEFMPELKWHWSYPIALLTMVVVAVGMLVYFRKRRWL